MSFGDCAVNPNPTAPQLAEIAVASARTAAIFGIEPRGGHALIIPQGLRARVRMSTRVIQATALAPKGRPGSAH